MSHSPKICKIGSMALAPIAVCVVGALGAGIVAAIIWTVNKLFPHLGEPTTPVTPSDVPGIVMACLFGAAILALAAHAAYPVLYRHCRGAKFLAAWEALEEERETAVKEWLEKHADISRRKRELMARGNSPDFNLTA